MLVFMDTDCDIFELRKVLHVHLQLYDIYQYFSGDFIENDSHSKLQGHPARLESAKGTFQCLLRLVYY